MSERDASLYANTTDTRTVDRDDEGGDMNSSAVAKASSVSARPVLLQLQPPHQRRLFLRFELAG